MAKKKDKSDGLTGILFEPKGDWAPPKQFPNLKDVKRIGLDTETKDLELLERGPGFIRGDAQVAGISISTNDMAWYFPIAHLGGGNMPRESVVSFLTDILKREDLWVIGANMVYDLEALWSLGVEVKGKIGDVQICEPLLDEERDDGYSLDELSVRYLKRRKEEALLIAAADAYGIDPKHGLWKLPSKYVGRYAEFDALNALQIWDLQIQKIKEENLEQVLDLELRLLPVLHKMRIRGIPINLEAAAALSKELKVDEEALHHQMIREFHADINVWSGPQIARVCDERGIQYPRTPKGAPSFESKWLNEFSDPFIQLVADIREVNKLRETFVNGWIFKNHVNGRIHPQWKQLASDDGGTRTGRLAASNPNPQQIPAAKKRNGQPNPTGAKIRSLFVSDTGKWCKMDYSQQEPRILTHFAALCKFTGAELAALAYRSDPKMDFYQFMVEAAGINRRMAKDMYLGRCYGMGKKKLAAKINKTVDEAAAILNDFDEKVPFVKEIAERCTKLAATRGYIKTLCGRRRHFNYWEPANVYDMRQQGRDVRPRRELDAREKWPGMTLARSNTHKALNALIQGSAADMMKMGLVLGYEQEKRIPYITVHDEVGGPVEDEADAIKWQHTMEHCIDLCVPIRADMKVGKSWV